MNPYRLEILSQSELDAHAQEWNDLWRRSITAQPTVTAQGLALWQRAFSADSEIRALAVRDGATFVAGLPLVRSRILNLVPIWTAPTNSSVNAGDVLIDPKCCGADALRLLVRGLSDLPHSLAVFDEVELESPRWQQFVAVLREEGYPHIVSPHNRAGVVDILHDWQRYEQSWSSNHRSAVKRSLKKIARAGCVSIERVQQPDDDQLASLLTRCFEIEQQGWKGAEGTAILSVEGMRDFYLAEARLVRDLGTLDLWLLKLDGEIIAFEYCHFSKGTSFSHKLSFDPRYGHLSPGRILRYHQLRAYHDDPQAHLFDMLGELSRSKASWATRTYSTGRCLVACGGRFSRALLAGYRRVKPILRKAHRAQTDEVKVGAARYLETRQAEASADRQLVEV